MMINALSAEDTRRVCLVLYHRIKKEIQNDHDRIAKHFEASEVNSPLCLLPPLPTPTTPPNSTGKSRRGNHDLHYSLGTTLYMSNDSYY